MPELLNYQELPNKTFQGLDTSFARAVIGDERAADFIPSFQLGRWSDEVWLRARLANEYLALESSPQLITPDKNPEGKIIWQGSKIAAEFYELPGGQKEGGGFEFDVVCYEKPPQGQIVMLLEHWGLDFFYQPALTSQEITDGAFRSENVIGSYAVYHATQSGRWLAPNGEPLGHNYMAGKFCHLFRPLLIDAVGKKQWGELTIQPHVISQGVGLLTVSAPDKFWSEAVYPVRRGAGLEFGYHTKGGTTAGNTSVAGLFTAPDNGSITAIGTYVYRGSAGGPWNIDAGYFNNNAGAIGTFVAKTTDTFSAPIDTWKEIAVSGAISSSALYWLCSQSSVSTTKYFDYTAPPDYLAVKNVYPEWKDNPSGYSYYADRKLSIYAVYTAAGGLSIPVAMHHLRQQGIS